MIVVFTTLACSVELIKYMNPKPVLLILASW